MCSNICFKISENYNYNEFIPPTYLFSAILQIFRNKKLLWYGIENKVTKNSPNIKQMQDSVEKVSIINQRLASVDQ